MYGRIIGESGKEGRETLKTFSLQTADVIISMFRACFVFNCLSKRKQQFDKDSVVNLFDIARTENKVLIT